MTFVTTITIPEERLDVEYHHLHHAEIFKVLEQGRLLFLEHIGVPQGRLFERDCFLVLQSGSAEFLREVREGPYQCTVDLKSISADRTAFTLTQELLKPPKKLAVRASFGLVAMSGATRRRQPLPSELEAKFLALLD